MGDLGDVGLRRRRCRCGWLAGAAVLLPTGGAGMASAVVGGALLCLAGFGAGSRRLEPVRACAHGARGGG